MKTIVSISILLSIATTIIAQDWDFYQRLTNPGGNSGSSAAIDGNIAVVGAPNDLTHGAAYIYYRDQGTGDWNHVKTLSSDLIVAGDFGESVSISGDNIIVGAPSEEDPVYSRKVGAIYIFNKNKSGSDNWGKVARIQPTADMDSEENAFGSNVSISGNYAVVGEIGPGNRAFLLYKDQGGTDMWEPMDTLWASTPLGFISAVSVNGNYAVVCDTRAVADTGTGEFTSGGAYVFYKDQGGTDQWGEVAKILAPDPCSMDFFGYSGSLKNNYLIIGAPRHDYDKAGDNYVSDAGAAYIFHKDQGGTDHWGNITKLTASDRYSGDHFGTSVTMEEDYAIVGAEDEDEDEEGLNTLSNAGSAYIFYRNQWGDNQWGELRKIVSSQRVLSEQFGRSVAMDGDYAVVGTQDEYSYMFLNYHQASEISFTSIGHNQVDAIFHPGNGQKRAVFAKEGIAGTASPEDSVDYSANQQFGSGDQIGSTGWFCVYDGTDTTVTVTGLTTDTYYTLMVIEYNLDNIYKLYNRNTASNNPVTQSTRVSLDAVETNVAEGLLLFASHKLEYSQNSTDGSDGDWYDCIDGDTPVEYIPGNVYVRQKTVEDNFRLIRSIPDPAVESLPGFTIDYVNEVTHETVGNDVEYNHDNDFESINLSGSGSAINILPDTTYYFRFKATDTTLASRVQTLNVPDRPPAPTFGIDYEAEKTDGIIANIYQYSTSPDMSGATGGINNLIAVTPGTDYYIRLTSTASSFSGYIQHLVVPERPAVPVVSLSDKNSSSATFMKSIDGSGDRVISADGYSYSTNNGSDWDIIEDETTVDASGNKNIIVRKNATSSSFRSVPTSNLDADKPVAVINSTTGCIGPGQTIEVQTNIDNGFVYIILDGESHETIYDLETAITSSKGSKTEITAAGTGLQIQTTGLFTGDYYAFATNTLDSISDRSSTSVTLYQNPSIDLGGGIIKCEDTEIRLDAGPGFSAYLWSPTGDTTQAIQVSNEGNYEVTVTDDRGCSNSDTYTVQYNVPFQDQEICIVTIDLSTSRNIIVWEKTPDAGILEYNIYRESTVGEFELIGTSSVNDLSVFRDETGEPWKQPYLYKITSVDTCGNESPVANSRYHKPSFLQYVSSEGGINLSWTDYKIEGVENIGDFLDSYSIYRGTDSTGLSEYAVLGSINNYTDTDPDAFTKRYYYRVAANFKDACIPTAGKKVDSDPYSHSMSNLEDNRFTVSGTDNSYQNFRLKIYPNPAMQEFTVEFTNPSGDPHTIILKDLSGRSHKIIDYITSRKVIIDSKNLPAGIYIIELKGNQIYREKIIIQ